MEGARKVSHLEKTHGGTLAWSCACVQAKVCSFTHLIGVYSAPRKAQGVIHDARVDQRRKTFPVIEREGKPYKTGI